MFTLINVLTLSFELGVCVALKSKDWQKINPHIAAIKQVMKNFNMKSVMFAGLLLYLSSISNNKPILNITCLAD